MLCSFGIFTEASAPAVLSFIHCPKKLFQTFVKLMLVPLSRMYLYFSVSKYSHVQCVGVVYSTV